MRLLLDGRYAPITSEVGLIEVPAEQAVAAFVEWTRTVHDPLGRTVRQRDVGGSLEDALHALLPLVSPASSRSLFVPTASSWTAYFSNGRRGTDAFPPMSYLARLLGCRGMRIVAAKDTMETNPQDPVSRYGALILEVYGPKPNPALNHVRTISLVDDDGWTFDQSGTAFPFENVASYAKRHKKDRFTIDMLEQYLAELGARPFAEEFYLPAGASATLVELTGRPFLNQREYSLAEAREGAP